MHMCSLRFVWNVKDVAVNKLCQHLMRSPWTHCLTPYSPDFTPSVSLCFVRNLLCWSALMKPMIWTQILWCLSLGSHHKHWLIPWKNWLLAWILALYVSVMGLTLRRDCPFCVGLYVPNIKQQNERLHVLQRFTPPPTAQIVTYFCVQQTPVSNPTHRFTITTVSAWVSYSFVGVSVK